MAERHNPKRRHMLGETRFLSEYLAEHYFGREWMLNFPVGTDPATVGVQISDPAEARLARNLNRRVDAIIVPPPDVVVIEAAMWDVPAHVGRLQGYLVLLEATPAYAAWVSYPLRPVLLTAQHDALGELLAQRAGIEYLFREPLWIGEWQEAYPHRRRRAPHAGLVAAAASLSEMRSREVPPRRGVRIPPPAGGIAPASQVTLDTNARPPS